VVACKPRPYVLEDQAVPRLLCFFPVKPADIVVMVGAQSCDGIPISERNFASGKRRSRTNQNLRLAGSNMAVMHVSRKWKVHGVSPEFTRTICNASFVSWA